MDEAKAKELKREFESARYRYGLLAHLVRRFVVAQIKSQFSGSKWLVLHHHTDRAKDPESLYRNLIANRYESSPTALNDIKDLAGARLIFYFRDDLDKFWEQSRPKFKYWFGQLAEETAKRALEPSSDPAGELFGYDSFHFICQVSRGTEFWSALNQRDRETLENFKCEVQLRTILQHAWAETEHDLRYKVQNWWKVTFPRKERRNWGLLAAILEAADLFLSERKTYYQELPDQQPEPDGIARWKYSGPKSGALVGDIRYEYEIVHTADEGSGRSAPVIRRDREIFDVDAAMVRAGGPPEYKKKMWEVLMEREPDFIMSSFTHDSTVVRAKDWDESAATLIVQPAQYSDQMVTNHKPALKQDVPSRVGLKVKDLAYQDTDEFRSFAESPMSKTIGIAGMLHTKDAKWVIGLRSRKVAFDPGQWGCSTSGALKWAEPETWGQRDLETWMKQALARECEEELGFRPSPSEIYYLAFAREFGRAGKPQFFFLIKHDNISWADVERAWQVYASDERELSKIKALDDEEARCLVGADADKVNRIIHDAGLSEELRMNLALALQCRGNRA